VASSVASRPPSSSQRVRCPRKRVNSSSASWREATLTFFGNNAHHTALAQKSKKKPGDEPGQRRPMARGEAVTLSTCRTARTDPPWGTSLSRAIIR
jgi:hypothetical protein